MCYNNTLRVDLLYRNARRVLATVSAATGSATVPQRRDERRGGRKGGAGVERNG